MMKITIDELLNRGWKQKVLLDKIVFYKKTINGFHYTLQESVDFERTNWYGWDLHIDNPDFSSVARLEVDTFEHIELISQIYSNEN